ncbi:hypothetical protein KSS87_014075 [Heliosperma pusillum]|nr:hypothetical protein KSS87_014075 [Heliosperma pusillum]
MENAKNNLMVLVVLVLLFVHGWKETEAQVHHVVGDDRGWNLTSNIASWAAARTFTVGDFLFEQLSSQQPVQRIGITVTATILYFSFDQHLDFTFVLWQKNMPFVGVDSTHFTLTDSRNMPDLQTTKSPFYVNGWNSYWLFEAPSRDTVSRLFKKASQLGLNVCRTWAFSDGPGPNSLQISPAVFNQKALKFLISLDLLSDLKNIHSLIVCIDVIYDFFVSMGWLQTSTSFIYVVGNEELATWELDYEIVEARKNGIRLILSLVNNLSVFGGKEQYVKWAQEAGVNISSSADPFFSDSTIKGYYKAYIKAILTRKNSLSGVRYSEEPAIFAWELINEPRCDSNSSSSILQAWITEMASYTKSLDQNHLVTVGLEGFYGPTVVEKSEVNPGEWAALLGTDFIQNSAIEGIDFASVHLYPDSWMPLANDTEKMNFVSKWMDSHISDAENILKKPVVFTEVGCRTDVKGQGIYNRKSMFTTVYDKIFESAKKGQAGGGAMIWQLLVEDMNEYGDPFSLVAWNEPTIYQLILKQSCRLQRSDSHVVHLQLSKPTMESTVIATSSIVSAAVSNVEVCQYNYAGPQGSSLTPLFCVLFAASSKIFVKRPINADMLHENQGLAASALLPHTDDLGFLDKAAIVLQSPPLPQQIENKWRLCRVTEVEETKTFIRTLPILMTLIMCGVISSLSASYFVEQANTMNHKSGRRRMPLVLFLWLYAQFSVESKRLDIVKSRGLMDKPDERVPMNVFSILPQFILLAGSEGIYSVVSSCFILDQGPMSMMKVISEKASGPNWFQSTLNQGRLDNFYWVLAVLAAVNLIVYVVISVFYQYRESRLEQYPELSITVDNSAF